MKEFSLINGSRANDSSGDIVPILSPSTGELIGSLQTCSFNDINEGVTSARRAQIEWACLSLKQRSSILKNAAILMRDATNPEEPSQELLDCIHNETGKLIPEATIEVLETADFLDYFATAAITELSDIKPSLDNGLWPSKEGVISKVPIGVVGIIKAWNYPLEIPIWSIAPAIVAGNSVVFKPALEATQTGLMIGQIFEKAGLPPGVLNILIGGAETGKLLVENPDVDMISFTGSVSVGMSISAQCGTLMKDCVLELGGNDPAIVTKKADLELAVNGLLWGSFCNAGQVCVRSKRILIDESIIEEFTSRLLERTFSLRIGIDIGPIITKERMNEIDSFVNDAVKRGAKILAGGRISKDLPGNYYLPTVLSDIDPDSRILKQECFGPVMPLIPYSDIDAAINIANSTNYGLGASVWTTSREEGMKIANRISAGMVWINDINLAFPQAPWGGWKRSGKGIELSKASFNEYTKFKYTCYENENATSRDWWYPY